jgi:hypothetical protein
MWRVPLTTVFDLVFALGIVVAAAALVAAAVDRASAQTLRIVVGLELVAALAAWVAFAISHDHDRELAIAAAGLTACTLVAAAAEVLRRAHERAQIVDAHFTDAQMRLRALVDDEAAARAAELERTLARARAESASLLSEQERRIADERRRDFAERERDFASSLTEALTATQAQVEQRLAGWAHDLDRAAEVTKARIAELAARQKQLLSDVEVRMVADAERLAAESEEQRGAVQRIRVEVERALEETLAAAHAEVEAHAVERRRALHELDERLRRRERELLELVQREEAEAVARIRAGFEDVQRRQIEQMSRVVERSATTYSDEAAQQFATLVKASREDAARRLARELDRSVEVFAREAESVLAERLAHVGDAGAQRLERRLAEATAALEASRDERLGGLDGRMAELEADIRRRIEELGADAEAQRAVIEARLQDLLRRAGTADVVQRH